MGEHDLNLKRPQNLKVVNFSISTISYYFLSQICKYTHHVGRVDFRSLISLVIENDRTERGRVRGRPKKSWREVIENDINVCDSQKTWLFIEIHG